MNNYQNSANVAEIACDCMEQLHKTDIVLMSESSACSTPATSCSGRGRSRPDFDYFCGARTRVNYCGERGKDNPFMRRGVILTMRDNRIGESWNIEETCIGTWHKY